MGIKPPETQQITQPTGTETSKTLDGQPKNQANTPACLSHLRRVPQALPALVIRYPKSPKGRKWCLRAVRTVGRDFTNITSCIFRCPSSWSSSRHDSIHPFVLASINREAMSTITSAAVVRVSSQLLRALRFSDRLFLFFFVATLIF